jgi:hypothetical protein
MNKVNLPTQLLLIIFLSLTGLAAQSQILTEGFESGTFPPTGWSVEHTAGDDTEAIWETATTGAEAGDDANGAPFTVDPHSGTGMAQFRSYDFLWENASALTTGAVDLSTAGSKLVTFWMYREDGYSASEDSVSVYINTSAGLTGATLLGVVHRFKGLSPIVTGANGWYRYSFVVPGGFNTATNYFTFLAVSDFGNNMFIDDITVEEFGACSGMPAAGTITGPADACNGTQVILENTGATDADGMTYQWQSSPTGTGSWSNISGQTTAALATATQTAVTYYRLFVTCTNSSMSDSSNVIQVGVRPTNECYCKPPDVQLHSFVNEYITNVTIQGTTFNASAAPTDPLTGYTFTPATPATNTADLTQVVSYAINVTVQDDPIQVSCWIDFNNNGSFDDNEYADLPVSGTLASGSISVPANAVLGLTGFRVRARAAEFDNTGDCETFGSGETEDYLVSITANTALNGALVDIIPPVTGCNASNDVVVKLRNSGNVNIAANAATVALYVTGANPQGPLTQTNNAEILPGDTATLTFTGAFPVAGANLDSAVIQTLAGDVNAADDAIVTSHITLPAAVNAPYAEDFEGAVPGWTVSQLAGTGVWGLSDGVSYPDYNPAYILAPKSGTSLALFDSYNFTAGTVSRASSNCINIPADANSGCGYVMGFYFTQDAQYLTLQDSIAVSVSSDGGATYTRLGVVKRLDSTLSPSQPQVPTSFPEWKLYTFDVAQYAGATLQFAFDAYGNFGNQMGIDSFFVGPKTVTGNIALAGGQETTAPLSPSLTQCTDADGWTYYSDGNSSRYLFGVQWDPGNTGANAAARAQATAKLTVDRKWYAAENPALQLATYTMQRYWDVNLNGAVMTGPVNVRFFYSQRELDSIIAVKNDFITVNGGNDEGFWWFKTTAGEFIPSPVSVTPENVQNSLILQDANVTNATINGVLYAQFNGVTDFSGGTAASGVGPSNPVPVGLLSFNAQRSARVNLLSWTTTQEINSSRFIVERGTDGRNFMPVGEVTAAGNSTSDINYSYVDHTPLRGVNFYRLKLVDRNGSSKYSAVRSVRNEGTADIAVYPNPVRDMMMVNITSDKTDRAVISITDMNGKLLQLKNTAIAEGINYININTATMAKGTYVLKIQLNGDMIVRKVNKQ